MSLQKDLKVDDIVRRLGRLGDEPERYGVIVQVYQNTTSHAGMSETLYAVQWGDNEQVETGYLAIGLERV